MNRFLIDDFFGGFVRLDIIRTNSYIGIAL